MPNNSSPDGPCCQVPGCKSSVVKDGHYFVRRRVCRKHCTADEIVVGDNVVRYCQQCSRLQPFDDFDAGRRSCRTSLAAHSQRRRLRGLGIAAAGKRGKASRSGSASGSNSGSSQQPSSSNSADAAGGSSTPGNSDQVAADPQQLQQEGQQQQPPVRTPSPGAATIGKDSLLLPLDVPPVDQMLALPQPRLLPTPSRQPTQQQQRHQAQQQQPQRSQAAADAEHRQHYQRQQAQASAPHPATQHRRLQPGSVSEALFAAIGEDIGQGLSPRHSMQGPQQLLAAAAVTADGRGSLRAVSGRGPIAGAAPMFGSAASGMPDDGMLYDTGMLPVAGRKRDREAMTQADIAAQFLGALEQRQQLQQQQRQQELLRLQRQRQQEQQQALYRQAPRLVQPLGSDSLANVLLSNLGLNSPSPALDDTLDWPQLRAGRSNSGAHNSGSTRSRDPAVQQLMSVLRNMPPGGMPLLQMAMQRDSQQGGARAQRSMRPPQVVQADLQLLQASMLSPSSRSPSTLAGTSAELSPSAQLTVSEAQTTSQRMRRSPMQLDGDSDSSSDGDTGPSTLRQRLTSLLKNLPPGGLPVLRAALQEAEQVPAGAAFGGERAVSSAGLRVPAGTHAQLPAAALLQQQGTSSRLQRAQHKQLAALAADQDISPELGRFFAKHQQLRMHTMTAGLVSTGAGADMRANKRRALAGPATTYGLSDSVQLMPDVQDLLYGAPTGLIVNGTVTAAGARVGVPRSAPTAGLVGGDAPLAGDMLAADLFGRI